MRYPKLRQLDIITDLQFGSSGKGLLAGYLAKSKCPDTLMTAWAPNAGHTFIDDQGNKYVHRMIPNGVVSPNLQRILIGPGSVIDPDVFMEELEPLRSKGIVGDHVKIVIHENAAVVTQEDRDWEKIHMVGIGSTMKGVGRALTRKIQRSTSWGGVAVSMLRGEILKYVVSSNQYDEYLNQAEVVLIEGHQGFSLSINHGFYPYVTSRDCTTMQILSDCGFPFHLIRHLFRFNSHEFSVWGTCRTYPIRVANRYNDEGKMVGWSGPCYPDQTEIQWADIGREPELTTVTRLPRRIFTWSQRQVDEAVRMNGVNCLFLNFVNYLPGHEQWPFVNMQFVKYPVMLVGMGPTENDVMSVSKFLGGIK